MMRATVTTKRQAAMVEIDNIHEMTPKAAIAFRSIAFGACGHATVRGGGKSYRVTGISGLNARARLIKA